MRLREKGGEHHEMPCHHTLEAYLHAYQQMAVLQMTTGITAYLRNGGTLKNAAVIANHASTRMTQLYGWRHDEISLDEVERIAL